MLPYKDWVKLNNGQRCHENLINQLPIVLTNAFICGLSFPRFTFGILSIYLVFRIFHIKGYLSSRGHNKVYAHEEFLKLLTIALVGGGFISSFKILGLMKLPS